jgi:hypothetical protein
MCFVKWKKECNKQEEGIQGAHSHIELDFGSFMKVYLIRLGEPQ